MFSSIILAAFSIVVFVYVRRKPRRALPLPPGPRKYPIIGSLLAVPDQNHWVAYDRIAKECNSDIIHLNVFGNSVIVLNSFAAASDVLDRQSSISSSRPEGTMINEVMGWKSMFSVQPYGQEWRDHRKAFWQEFHPEHGKLLHRPVQLRCSRDLIRRLYESPLDFQSHICHMIASSILIVIYGVDVQEKNDPHITMAENALKHLDLGFIGTYMVDVFPFLKHIPRWMPGAGFQTIGDNASRDLNLLIEGPYSQTRNLLTEGRGESSFIHRALSRGSILDGGKEERIIKNTAATAYLGANETSKFSMRELDQYLDHRLPEFEDEDYLPYTFAVMLEVLRLEPITPLGLPHSLIADGEYKGYHLPSGSVVFCNLWAILRDETVFSEPEEFKPSRFLKDGQIDPRLKDYFMTAFGFGRRICPGRYFAMDNLWLNMASILSVYTIAKAVDENGREIDIVPEYTTNLNRHVLPFKCSIKPRSDMAEELIRECRRL
ncbi:cytochrome P450 family protein [Pleurotus pulmonarius]